MTVKSGLEAYFYAYHVPVSSFARYRDERCYAASSASIDDPDTRKNAPIFGFVPSVFFSVTNFLEASGVSLKDEWVQELSFTERWRVRGPSIGGHGQTSIACCASLPSCDWLDRLHGRDREWVNQIDSNDYGDHQIVL